MLKAFEIFESIKNTSGTKAKGAIIEKNKNNALFIRIAIFLLDSNVKTNLSNAKINKDVNRDKFDVICDIESFLDYLAFDCTGTNKNIASVQEFIYSCSPELQEFLKGIATKSYKFGVAVKGFNAIVPIVSTHDVMRAKNFSDELHKLNKKYPDAMYSFSQKIDGIRCTAFITEGKVDKLLSRSNKEFIGFNEIFEGLPTGVYDGEFDIPGADFNTIQSTVMTSILSEGEDISEILRDKLEYKVFDMITHDDYKAGTSKKNYAERRKDIEAISLPDRVKVIDVLATVSFSKLVETKDRLFQEAMENGWEGLMVNITTAPYQSKRTDAILKVKEFETIDLKIVGFNKGEGKFSHTTGSIACEYKGNIVDIPSMKDEIRNLFWNNQERFIGRTIEVKYFQESSNEKGEMSLRHPSFIRLREDK
ncbi:MAG: hypothetical protein ACRDCW_02920 [Sarcina sp.]